VEGYKVLTPEDGRLLSAITCGTVVAYKVGEAVGRPDRCGPLAVFQEKDAALSWRKQQGGSHVVYRCKYAPSQERTLYYYDLIDHEIIRTSQVNLPFGTVLADSVTLLEEVTL
jgi:hypothetical protein